MYVKIKLSLWGMAILLLQFHEPNSDIPRENKKCGEYDAFFISFFFNSFHVHTGNRFKEK